MDKLKLENVLAHIVSSQERPMAVAVPEALITRVKKFTLAKGLRARKESKTGVVIYSEVQRAFGKVYTAIKAYEADPSPENEKEARYYISLATRTFFQHGMWRNMLGVKGRDSKNSASCYLVAVPMPNLDGSSRIAADEVGLHPETAEEMGFFDGACALMSRDPATDMLPMTVVIRHDVGRYVMGLAVGSIEGPAKLTLKEDVFSQLGADADGDCMKLQRFFQEECNQEIRSYHSSRWQGNYNLVPSGICYTWKDEDLSKLGKCPFATALQKSKQKNRIGSAANSMTAIELCLTHGFITSISYEEWRVLNENQTEVVMDCKGDTDDKPDALVDLLNDDVYWEDVVEELTKQHYDMDVVFRLYQELQSGRNTLSGLASQIPEFAVKIGDRATFEALAAVLPHENFTQKFTDCMFGWDKLPDWTTSDSLWFAPQATGRYEKPVRETFSAELVEDRLVVKCKVLDGGVAVEFKTESDGNIVLLNDDKVIFRTTLFVPWRTRPFEHQDRDGNTILKKGSTKPRLWWEVTCGEPFILDTWDDLLRVLLAENFLYQWNDIRKLKADEADVAVTSMLHKALRFLLSSPGMEVEFNDAYSYASKAGAFKLPVLDNKLPCKPGELERLTNPDGSKRNKIADIKELRCQTAGKWLATHKQPGSDLFWINSPCDTISGEPGMAFYIAVDPMHTFATMECLTPQFIPHKRRPVVNAQSNYVELENLFPRSIKIPEAYRSPRNEVYVVALPIDLYDALMLSYAAMDKFRAKVWDSKTGRYISYPATDGAKLQCDDVKGVAKMEEEEWFPWIRFADGTEIRVEVVVQLASKGHLMLRSTHFGMALNAVAKANFDKTGKQMVKPPVNLTEKQITDVCIKSGLYADDNLTVEILSPDKQTVLGRYPAGVMAFGMHRQIPQIVSSLHGRNEEIPDYIPTSIADGGIVNGDKDVMIMKAHGLESCARELHSEVNPVLRQEVQDLLDIVERVTPEDLAKKRGASLGKEFAALEAALATKFRR